MTAQTTLPPLTQDEFEICFHTFDGVTLVEDEDASFIAGYGHIEPAAFAQAVRTYDLELAGQQNECDPAEVQHVWAITLSNVDEQWVIAWATHEAPNAFALTKVNR